MLLKKHSKMQKMRNLKKHLREAANQQKRFRNDPWKFGTEVFNPRNVGKPTFSKETAEEHFVSTYKDMDRDLEYTAPPGCTRPNPPRVEFNLAPIEMLKLRDAVQKKGNKNAPGLNAIPFLVYKKCPQLLDFLLRIMNRVWTEKKVPTSWQRVTIVLLAYHPHQSLDQLHC